MLDIKKIQTFVKMTPATRSVKRRRLITKTGGHSLPAPARAISLPLQEPVSLVPPNVRAYFLDKDLKNTISNMMMDPAAADDCHVSSIQSFFHLHTAAADHSGHFEPGSVKLLAARVAKHWPVVVQELGEPRALAVYSSMSGILQKVPPCDTFGNAVYSIEAYVAALLYVGWELAGSAESEGPSVMHTVPQARLMHCVYRFLGYISR